MEDTGVEHAAGPGPVSLRVSVTDRCQLRCCFCTPAAGLDRFQPTEIIRYEEILRFVRLIRARFGLSKVHVTGGEPLVRRGILRFVEMLADEGIEDLAMTTNGQLLAPLAADLKQAGLRRINISLYTLNGPTFARLTRGGDLARTLAGIDSALRAGLAPVKCNTIALRGVNDHELVDIARAGIGRGIEVRFIELMPIGPAAARHQAWFVPSSEILERLRRRFDVRPLPRRKGISARQFRLDDAVGNTGVVGLISSCTEPFCDECNRLRLTANGNLVGCLAEDGAESIAPHLRTGGRRGDQKVLETVAAVLEAKCARLARATPWQARRGFSSGRYMVGTGG